MKYEREGCNSLIEYMLSLACINPGLSRAQPALRVEARCTRPIILYMNAGNSEKLKWLAQIIEIHISPHNIIRCDKKGDGARMVGGTEGLALYLQ